MTMTTIDDAQQVMSHAGADDDDGQEYISNAMQHVQDNSVRTIPYLIRAHLNASFHSIVLITSKWTRAACPRMPP